MPDSGAPVGRKVALPVERERGEESEGGLVNAIESVRQGRRGRSIIHHAPVAVALAASLASNATSAHLPPAPTSELEVELHEVDDLAEADALLAELTESYEIPASEGAAPPEVLIELRVDEQVVYLDKVAPVFDEEDGRYHYRGSATAWNSVIRWDWRAITEDDDVVHITGTVEIVNADITAHEYALRARYVTHHLGLPVHDHVYIPFMSTTTHFIVDDNGGTVATEPDAEWGTAAYWNHENQWGNHYNPWYMYHSHSGIILYQENWHDVDDRAPITGPITITQSYRVTDGEQLEFSVLYRFELVR